MKSKIIKIMMIAILALTVVMLAGTLTLIPTNTQTRFRNEIVALNEIEQLIKADSNDADSRSSIKVERSIKELQDMLKDGIGDNGNRQIFIRSFLLYLISVLFIIVIFIYVYIAVIRPFYKMTRFASEVAQGNFESPLYYERMNLFGEFTWAFDHMRKEVMKARQCEKEAIENNKTVIATISHDIKTPIASIRAYAEGLQAGMDYNPERKERYLSVIIRKCDEVSKLTNDLFLHSLSDLDKLQMNLEYHRAETMIGKILEAVRPDNMKIMIRNKIPDAIVLVDGRRLEQVFENLIGNALKYAEHSEIEIIFDEENQFLKCHIRDYGEGIAEEDMPFIFEKFYRGKNTTDRPGSGLGLYIVKYIMEQMDGSVQLINRHPGLEAVLEIPIKSQ